MDKLDQLFQLQASLNKKIGLEFTPDMTEEQKAEWILNYTRAMSQEISELIDSVPWKWWAKYQKFDAQNVVVELIDILHFWISACQVMNLSSEDVFRIYSKKHEINVKRQNDGYKEKDSQDCKHIE
ncbi:MAG: dUTPase [uncultured bacterium]|nr:MAG: dUTPase [uncultured bacterium]